MSVDACDYHFASHVSAHQRMTGMNLSCCSCGSAAACYGGGYAGSAGEEQHNTVPYSWEVG